MKSAPPIALAAAIGLAVPVAPALAHVVSDREVRVLQALPWSDVAAALASSWPDSAGAVAPDDASLGWSAGPQAGAMLLLMTAASRADSVAAERAWRAVDFAFVRQRRDGGFDLGRPGSSATPRFEAAIDPGPVSLIGELGRAEIALENGPVQARFHWRVVLMLPKLRRSLDSLVAGAATIESRGAGRPGELMSAASCCLLGDGIYHVETIGLAGQRLLVAALATQSKGGQFRADSPGALAEHALALEKLQPLVLYFPAPSLEDAEKRAAQWLLEKMESGTKPSDWSAAPSGSGAITARRAQARALFALMHFAERSSDSGFRSRVERAVRKWVREPRTPGP